MLIRLLSLAALLFAIPASGQVGIELVELSFAPHACDTQSQGCFGAVPYGYWVGKFEVSNAEYAEFLNAVAKTDTNGLYSPSMGSGLGGITRSGSSPIFSYSAIAGREDMPVIYVSFWDATRFANWLHNGQPTGAQNNTTTENGAYTLTPNGITNNTVTRNAGAKWFVTSEDEWYKAAYYDTGSTSYFDYPAGSDTQTTCTVSGATANTANCDEAVVDLTDAGSYTGAASPNGTFDQGGNVWEWNETIVIGSRRGVRGGNYFGIPDELAASHRGSGIPDGQAFSIGFRVASRDPAFVPSVPSLSPIGLILVAAGLLGSFAYLRRRL